MSFTIESKKAFASAIISTNSKQERIAITEKAIVNCDGKGNKKDLETFKRFLETGIPQFKVFTIGNSKLPFISFSALSLFTCPGMGECANYCYTLTGWRYAAPFLRQLQNTILLRSIVGQRQIMAEASKLLETKAFKGRKGIDFRLYVDGDFDSIKTMKFWFQEFLPTYSQLAVYGYSKSWELLIEYGDKYEFPNNYVLNVSNGSKYDGNQSIKAKIMALPITRHEFIAVKLNTKKRFSAPKGEYATKEYRLAVAEAFGNKKHFPCPGLCGSCTKKTHVCGNKKVNVPVVIGIH